MTTFSTGLILENWQENILKIRPASQGGELDWLPRGVTAPEFEAAMVNAEINVLSPIFETQFGFHFLEVLDKRTEDITDITIEDRAYSVLFARKFDEEP